MCKIEEAMLKAIRERNYYTCTNTRVVPIDYADGHKEPYVEVWLHSTCIAQVYADHVVVRSGGWHTVTTKSRLNAILDEFTNRHIFQRDRVWYIVTGRGPSTVDNTRYFEDGMSIPRIR